MENQPLSFKLGREGDENPAAHLGCLVTSEGLCSHWARSQGSQPGTQWPQEAE